MVALMVHGLQFGAVAVTCEGTFGSQFRAVAVTGDVTIRLQFRV